MIRGSEVSVCGLLEGFVVVMISAELLTWTQKNLEE